MNRGPEQDGQLWSDEETGSGMNFECSVLGQTDTSDSLPAGQNIICDSEPAQSSLANLSPNSEQMRALKRNLSDVSLLSGKSQVSNDAYLCEPEVAPERPETIQDSECAEAETQPEPSSQIETQPAKQDSLAFIGLGTQVDKLAFLAPVSAAKQEMYDKSIANYAESKGMAVANVDLQMVKDSARLSSECFNSDSRLDMYEIQYTYSYPCTHIRTSTSIRMRQRQRYGECIDSAIYRPKRYIYSI